jgi:T5SS/PEP-CTERM-associated repeat protein
MGYKSEIRRGILFSAVAGAFAASGLANASTPTTPPAVPTAPVMPAFDAYTYGPTDFTATDPGTMFGDHQEGSTDDTDPFTFTPPSYSAGGYEPLNTNPQILYTSEKGYGGGETSDSSPPVPYITPTYNNCVAPLMYSQPNLYPLVIASQTVSIEDGSGGGYVNGKVGFLADAGYTPSNMFDWGSSGYNWLKVTKGGILNTTLPGFQGSSGYYGYSFVGQSRSLGATFVGTTLLPLVPSPGNSVPTSGPSSYAAYVAVPPYSSYLNFGGPATGYGIVNVDGGAWSDSGSPIYVGYGGQGFVTLQKGGTLTVGGQAIVVGEDSAGLPTSFYTNINQSHQTIALPHLAAGIGTMVVESGGSLTLTGTGGYVALGRSVSSSGATGNLYVTGAGSTASVSQGILVGDGGTGTLVIESGASVTSGSAYAAGPAKTYGLTSQPGSGQVVIDGASSVWNVSGNADFGVSGVANVTVQNHGDLSVGGTLTLGDQSTGNGTLTVQADGSVESGDATLGNQAGASGSALVTGINTAWTVDGDLTVGSSGTGNLTVNSNGILTTTGDATLGSEAGSLGNATISDAGTNWQINGELKVGDNGTGTLLVQNGGLVSLAGNLALGDSGGSSTGNITLDASRMTVGGTSVTIGGKGQGTLTVQNAAAAIFSGASVSLGESSGSAGTLTVQNGNTTMSTGSLTVGGQGTGTLNLLDTASLTTDNSFTLGEDASGVGTATIDNSSMTDTSTLTVGGSGSGTLNIQNGGSLTVQGNDITLGEQAGSNGVLNLTGNGSTLTFNGDVTVGKSGTGVFSVASDAHFSGTSMTLASGTGFGGSSTGGSGSLDISGGSSVSLSQDITIGKYGSGTIALTGSSFLSSQGDVTLGSQPGTQGTAVVDSGSSWSTAGSFTIGSEGSGTVTIKGGSSLMADGDALTIGKGGGAGTLTATDQKTQVQYAGDLIIGKESDGTFNIQNGAVAQATASGTGDVYLAETSGINGNLNIDGSTSSLSAVNMVVGGTSSKSGGDGVVDLTDGGQMTVAKALTMWKNGSLNLAGSNYSGGITIGTGTAATAGNIEINSNGQLAASGSITGNVLNDGGTVAVGNGQPGTLKITGNFSQTGGVTKVSVFGISSGQFSQLEATGNVSFSGGTVEFDFGNGFAPLKGQTFQFIDPPQSVDVNGLTYSFTGLAPGFDFTVTPDSNGLLFTALNNGIATTTATPEPASLGLLAIGGASLLLLRRRSRS